MLAFAFTLSFIVANCGPNATNATLNDTTIFPTDVMSIIRQFIPLRNKLTPISKAHLPTHLTIDSDDDLQVYIDRLAVFFYLDNRDKHLVDEWFKRRWNLFTQQTKDNIKDKVSNSTLVELDDFSGYLLIDMHRPGIMNRIKSKSFVYELFPDNNTLSNPNAPFDSFEHYLENLVRHPNISNPFVLADVSTYVQNAEDIIHYLVETHGTNASFALGQLHHDFWYILSNKSLVDRLINNNPSVINAFVEYWCQITSFTFNYYHRKDAPWRFILNDQLKITVIRNSRKTDCLYLQPWHFQARIPLTITSNDSDVEVVDYVERLAVFCDVNDTDKPLLDDWFKDKWNLFSNQTKDDVQRRMKNRNFTCNNADQYLLLGMADPGLISRMQSKAFLYEAVPACCMFTNANASDALYFAMLLIDDGMNVVNESVAAIYYQNLKDVIEYFIAANGMNTSRSKRVLSAIHVEFASLFHTKVLVDTLINPIPAIVIDFVQYWCKRTSLKFGFSGRYNRPWQHIQNDTLKRMIIMNSQKTEYAGRSLRFNR